MIGLCGVVATLVNFQNKTFSRKSSSPEQTCGNSQCQETTTAKCDRLLNQFGFIQTKEKSIFTYKDENDIVFLVNSGKLFILYDKRINLFMPIELFRLYMKRMIINLVLNTWWYFKIRLLFFIEQSSGKGPTDDKLKNYFMKMIDEIFVLRRQGLFHPLQSLASLPPYESHGKEVSFINAFQTIRNLFVFL